MKVSIVQRFRNAHSGSKQSYVAGAIVFVATTTSFWIVLQLLDNRSALVETGQAVSGIMSIVAVTFGAIALWSTIDSNSALSERADRVFASKQALEEALALCVKTAWICGLYQTDSTKALVRYALDATRIASQQAMSSGLFRLLSSRDSGELKRGDKEHIENTSSLQFLAVLLLLETSKDNFQANFIELVKKFSDSLTELRYSDIRRSLREEIPISAQF